MRRAFAHEAELSLGSGDDAGAPGASITAALCGSWEHTGPCPLAPHHTSVTRTEEGRAHLRTLFVAEPEREADVRQLLEHALEGGRLVRPDGEVASWQLLASRTAAVRDDERDHAERLRQS